MTDAELEQMSIADRNDYLEEYAHEAELHRREQEER